MLNITEGKQLLSGNKTILSRLADICELRTTGGKGGTVTTVSTLAQFTAVANNAKNNDITPRIIVVSGTITGATQVRIGSNKTILGLPGASMFSFNPAGFQLTVIRIRWGWPFCLEAD
jgi:pectate lyase